MNPTKCMCTLQPEHPSLPASKCACWLHLVFTSDFPWWVNSPRSISAPVQSLDRAPEEPLGPHYYEYGQGKVPGLEGLVCSQALLLCVLTYIVRLEPICSSLKIHLQLLNRKNTGNGNSDFMENHPYALFWNKKKKNLQFGNAVFISINKSRSCFQLYLYWRPGEKVFQISVLFI